MRRQLPALIVGLLMSLGVSPFLVSAQETDLEDGIFVDQLSGFSVYWDPEAFTGSLDNISGIQIEGLGSTGTLSTSSATSAAECLERVQSTAPLGEPMWDGVPPVTPSLPAGSASELGMTDRVTFRACIADPANPSGTTFILLTLAGPGPKAEWEAAVAAWQGIIDSIVFPNPALLTSTGIIGNVYTDPLFGWSVQFEPERYEAQYAAGSADSPYLSGLFLYSEAGNESGGIWAERHKSSKDCLEAQRAVNADLPGFGDAHDVERLVTTGEAITSATWSFTLEPDGRFLVFAGCQPLHDGSEQVEGVYLVTTFTVPETGYADAVTAWDAMLQALSFRSNAPNGTPIS